MGIAEWYASAGIYVRIINTITICRGLEYIRT